MDNSKLTIPDRVEKFCGICDNYQTKYGGWYCKTLSVTRQVSRVISESCSNALVAGKRAYITPSCVEINQKTYSRQNDSELIKSLKTGKGLEGFEVAS